MNRELKHRIKLHTYDDNPYKGIYPYTAEDKDFFWGRNNEINDISESILASPSTILTGYSGCGKTSLIQAGILPHLDKYNFHVIKVTPKEVFKEENRSHFAIDFWEKINEKINQWINDDKIENGQTVDKSKLSAINKIDNSSPNKLSESTLWEKMFLYNFTDKNGFAHFFVIVLDQFEELFQLGLNIKEVERVFKIYEILCGSYNPSYDYIDKEILTIISEDYTDSHITTNNVFNYESYASYNTQTNYNRFLISIRKDYLYDLQSYSKRYPVLTQNIKYVENLNDDQAREVIDNSHKFKPFNIKKDEIQDSVAYKITKAVLGKRDYNPYDDKTDYRIDTMILSVVLFELCNSKEDDEVILYAIDEKGYKYIDINGVNFEKKFKSILDKFYNDRINSIIQENEYRKEEKKTFIRKNLRNCNINVDSIIDKYDELENKKSREQIEKMLRENGISDPSLCQKLSKEIKKFSLTDIISLCPNPKVKDKLEENIDNILYDLQSSLVSESGMYRKPVHLYEIRKLFDKYVYGNINFKNVCEWIDTKTYQIKQNSIIANIFSKNNLKITGKNGKIIENFSDSKFEKFRESIDAVLNATTDKGKDNAGKKCTEEFNKIVYGSYKDYESNKSSEIYICDELIRVITNCKLFVGLSNGDEDIVMEFRHDRLCALAQKNLKIYEIRQDNAKRYTADFYFTPQGRLKDSNCFVECVFGPWNTYSAVMRTVYFMEGEDGSSFDFELDSINRFKTMNYNRASSTIVTLALNDKVKNVKARNVDAKNVNDKEEYYHNLPELFSHIRVKIEKGKIYNISFEDRVTPIEKNEKKEYVEKIVIPTGFHKVRFYYDKYHRIAYKDFCVRNNDDQDVRHTIPDGNFNAVYYIYNNFDKYPCETYFLNLDESIDLTRSEHRKKIREHFNEDTKKKMNNGQIVKDKYAVQHSIDGNYGYESKYDEYGREISRTFIGNNHYGYGIIKFEKDKNNMKNNHILSVSYFDKNDNKVTYHKDGKDSKVHKVKFYYDSENRIYSTEYYNNEDMETICKNELTGIIGEQYEFEYKDEKNKNNNNVFIRSSYKIDKKRKVETEGKIEYENIFGADNKGVKYAMMHRDTLRGCIDYIEWRDDNGPINGRNIDETRIYSKIILLDSATDDTFVTTTFENTKKEIVKQIKLSKKLANRNVKKYFNFSFSKALLCINIILSIVLIVRYDALPFAFIGVAILLGFGALGYYTNQQRKESLGQQKRELEFLLYQNRLKDNQKLFKERVEQIIQESNELFINVADNKNKTKV